jgi:hypothetical protein
MFEEVAFEALDYTSLHGLLCAPGDVVRVIYIGSQPLVDWLDEYANREAGPWQLCGSTARFPRHYIEFWFELAERKEEGE